MENNMVVLNIFHVLIAIAMVALVLVQRGAGATAGAAFGSGASGTVFGSRGAGTFLTKSTWVLATLFCAISLVMAVMVSRMDTTPEANLGVIAAAPAVEEIIESESTGQGAANEEGDLPALLNSQDDAGEPIIPQDPVLQNQAADDLPALNGSETVVTEGATDGSAGGNEGDTAAGADTDDS